MVHRSHGGLIRALALAAALILLPDLAAAQHFGENKVQYRRHQFQVLHTDHFDIYFHQDRRDVVDIAGRLAERWFRRLSRVFGQELYGRQTIVLYSSKADFDQTSIVAELIDPGTAGVTEGGRRRIALPLAGPLADTDHVLGHEIVHAFQFDLLGSQPAPQGTAAPAMPLWAVEGLAEYLTLGAVEPHTAMWLRDAVAEGRLPTLAQLDRPEYFPYRWGHAAWAYIAGRWGEDVVVHLFTMAAFLGMPAAIETLLGVTPDEFARDWHQSIRAAYPITRAADVGAHVIGAQTLGGSINVGAAISPDGKWIACLTERVFSIDLVVVEAASGRVAATLTDMAANQRYSSLPFVASAAAWDAAGERLAIGTLKSGRAAIAVFRWPGGRLEQDIVVPGVDEILGPVWSPDGRHLAFSAMSGGVTDLFTYDVVHQVVRRLTDDLFADLQPAWAPDGQRLAFVTDRFTTDLGTLAAGEYRLAVLDVRTGVVEAVPAFPAGKHIAPQWAADGESLYFIADPDGTPDVYQVQLATGALARHTHSTIGLSGLTASSPALSVAPRAGVAAVSVYERGAFAIHSVALGAASPVIPGAGASPRLPPADAPPHAAAPPDAADAAAPASWPVSRYRPRLGLEALSQVSLGAGVSAYGASAGGGLAAAFSDVLNQHWLVAAVQLDAPFGFSLHDIGAQGMYVNQVRRWNWGVAAGVGPAYMAAHTDPVDASGVESIVLVRQTERAARAHASYAFSRARRLELHGGVTRLGFDRLAAFDELGPTWTPAARPMTLSSAGLAFVSDTSRRGPTSVVRGERYRFDAVPVVGTIQYVSVAADYRRYVMPVPFYTIAARAMHVGRYGTGADDVRLPPLYLGDPWFVRGYDLGAGVSNGCLSILSGGCPGLGTLLGSRLAVANLELRVPLLRPFGLSPGMYGPVPAEIAVFVDGGMAWDSRRAPAADRGAYSAGVTLRTTLFGFGVGQLDVAHPFDHSARGWVFQFNLVPAF